MTSKARVRYDMTKKQSLSFEKCKHFIFHCFKYSLHLFKPSTVWGLGYTVLTRSMLWLIKKSSQFCYAGNKYEVAITYAFGRRLRMRTSAVPTCTANMHVRATLLNYRVLRYLIWFLEEKCSQHSLLVCLKCSF